MLKQFLHIWINFKPWIQINGNRICCWICSCNLANIYNFFSSSQHHRRYRSQWFFLVIFKGTFLCVPPSGFMKGITALLQCILRDTGVDVIWVQRCLKTAGKLGTLHVFQHFAVTRDLFKTLPLMMLKTGCQDHSGRGSGCIWVFLLIEHCSTRDNRSGSGPFVYKLLCKSTANHLEVGFIFIGKYGLVMARLSLSLV